MQKLPTIADARLRDRWGCMFSQGAAAKVTICHQHLGDLRQIRHGVRLAECGRLQKRVALIYQM